MGDEVSTEPLRRDGTDFIAGLFQLHRGNRMSEESTYGRRRFLGSAAMTIAAAKLAMIDSGSAAAAGMPKCSPKWHFG